MGGRCEQKCIGDLVLQQCMNPVQNVHADFSNIHYCMLGPFTCNIHIMMLLVRQKKYSMTCELVIHASAIALWGKIHSYLCYCLNKRVKGDRDLAMRLNCNPSLVESTLDFCSAATILYSCTHCYLQRQPSERRYTTQGGFCPQRCYCSQHIASHTQSMH